MANTFNEVFEDIRSNISTSKAGKPIRSFSRADFDRLAKALLNDPNYSMQHAAVKKGELELKESQPVQLFRGMIQRILVDFGVDKAESARVMTDAYEIANVNGLYEICSELIYKYVEAGKKFDFVPKEDFVGSILLREVEEEVKENTHPTTKEVTKTRNGKHKSLKVKSSTPKWVKTRIEDKK